MGRHTTIGLIAVFAVGCAACTRASTGAGARTSPAAGRTASETAPASDTASRGERPPTGEAPEPVRSEDTEAPTAPEEIPAQWRCPVQVLAVVSDERYRGHPRTPASVAQEQSMSPEDFEMSMAESHGAYYRECVYLVHVNDADWRFTEWFDETFGRLPADQCQLARPDVERSIQVTTRGCTELQRGAYWGHELRPVQ